MASIKQIELQKKVVEHLMELGWSPNHEYLDSKFKNLNDGDLKRFMFGYWNSNYYLIHKNNKHVCTIELRTISFWQLNPFLKLGSFHINKNLEMMEHGLKEVRTRKMYYTTYEIDFNKMN